MSVFGKLYFFMTNEYENIFMASKSNKCLPNEYILLWILDYSNEFEYSLNECPNKLLALEKNKNFDKSIYLSTNLSIYLNIWIFATHCMISQLLLHHQFLSDNSSIKMLFPNNCLFSFNILILKLPGEGWALPLNLNDKNIPNADFFLVV